MSDTSDYACTSVARPIPQHPQRVLKPIAGCLPQDDRDLTKIIGKPQQYSPTNHTMMPKFTLADLLPNKQ